MQAGVFLVFQTCLLLDRRYWKWNSYGELVETCFGMNRAAILALSIFPVALQMALCGEPRGKCLALQPWCIPGMSFPTINCVNSGCGVWEGAVVFTCLWPGPIDPMMSIWWGLCGFIVAVDEALGGESLSSLVLLYRGHSPDLQFSLSHLLPNFLSCSRRWASSGLGVNQSLDF